MNKYASLCILSYQRPDFLQRSFESLWATMDYPAEIIINDDGSSQACRDFISGLLTSRRISFAIINAGQNMGIGNAMTHCASISSGDYIFKIDTDMDFKPHWLSTAIGILDNNPRVGTVSLFNYRHNDPKDDRFNILAEKPDCYIVNDFVSSIYGFRRKDLDKLMPFEVDGNHLNLPDLAITKSDYVDNFGFGLEKSIYLNHMEKSDLPLIFGSLS